MLSETPIWCRVYLKRTSTPRYKSVSLYITSFNFKTLFWLVLSWYDAPWIQVCSDIFSSIHLSTLSSSSHSASCCSNMPCLVWTLAVIPAILTKALCDVPQSLQSNCWDSTSIRPQQLLSDSTFTHPYQQYYAYEILSLHSDITHFGNSNGIPLCLFYHLISLHCC